MRRNGPAVAEFVFAGLGLAFGVVVMTLISSIGFVPSEGPWARAWGFVAGPMLTLVAVVTYQLLGQILDGANPAWRVDEDPKPRPVRSALVFTLVGIALAILGSVALGQILHVLGLPVKEQGAIVEIVRDFRAGGARIEVSVMAVAAVGLAPVVEEWMFRGTLFRRIRGAGLRPSAYALSALLFALIHANLAGFAVYAWLGLVFAWTYEKTGRLSTAVAVHMANNAFALTVLLVMGPEA